MPHTALHTLCKKKELFNDIVISHNSSAVFAYYTAFACIFQEEGGKNGERNEKNYRKMQEKTSRRQGREGKHFHFVSNQVVLTPSLSKTKNTMPKISPTMALRAIPLMDTCPICTLRPESPVTNTTEVITRLRDLA